MLPMATVRGTEGVARHVSGRVLTLAVLGEDAGGDAADVLPPDAGVLDLHLDGRQRHHVDVALVGQHHQAALAVVLRPAAAEPGHAHPPHPGAVHGRQLQLHLRAHFGQREDLDTGTRSSRSSVNKLLYSVTHCLSSFILSV